MIHVNIRSIPANLNIFVSYMSNIDHDFPVIGFSETLSLMRIELYTTMRAWLETTGWEMVYRHWYLTLMYAELQESTVLEDQIETFFF